MLNAFAAGTVKKRGFQQKWVMLHALALVLEGLGPQVIQSEKREKKKIWEAAIGIHCINASILKGLPFIGELVGFLQSI